MRDHNLVAPSKSAILQKKLEGYYDQLGLSHKVFSEPFEDFVQLCRLKLQDWVLKQPRHRKSHGVIIEEEKELSGIYIQALPE